MTDVASGLAELSVFLPVFNEAGRIVGTIENVLAVLPRVAGRFELIVVDDGSRDGTARLIRERAARASGIRVVTHAVNRGYGAALRSGFAATGFEWVAYMDSDGQFDFGEIAALIAAQRETGADLVAGYYRARSVSAQRKLNTWLWETLATTLFGLHMRSIDCGFKLLRRAVLENIPALQSERGAFISTELLVKARAAGFRIAEAPVTHSPRRSGHATGASPAVIARSFADLWRLRRELRR